MDLIDCRATCNPECNYTWFKDTLLINVSSALSLGTAFKNMTGNYTCEAFNMIGGQRRGVGVIVLYAPVVKLRAAVQDFNPYKVKQGRENVVLVCDVVDAYPPPTSFIWTHNGTTTKGGSNFTIPIATRQTNGTWGCKGINGYGTPLESQLQVDVQYGPIIMLIGNKTVRENQLFSVTCNIDSNPFPLSVLWTKDNNSTFSQKTSTLKVDSVNRYDSGTYRCTAVNTIHPSALSEESMNGTEWFYLDVQYGAEIINLSVAGNNTVNENATATLRCFVDSNPKSNITWSKQGILGNLQTNYFVHESQLIIEHAQCLDTLNYTCNANNGLGSSVERNIPLYVRCHPRTDFRFGLETKIYKKCHEAAILRYTVIAYPPPIFTWIFLGNGSEGMVVPVSASQHDNGQQSELKITNLVITDFGVYSVIASNSLVPLAMAHFEIIQAVVPDIPSNVTVIDIKQTSLTVHWIAGHNGGLQQTFHIIITIGAFIGNVYAPDPGYGKSGTQTIDNLMANTEYNISMTANNVVGSSNMSNVIKVITLKVLDETSTSSPSNPSPISAVAGGVAGAIVAVILLVGISILIWRRYQHKKSMKEQMYENATHVDGSSHKENVYEGLSNKSDENGYDTLGAPNAYDTIGAPNGTCVEKDGVMYVNLNLKPVTNKYGEPNIGRQNGESNIGRHNGEPNIGRQNGEPNISRQNHQTEAARIVDGRMEESL